MRAVSAAFCTTSSQIYANIFSVFDADFRLDFALTMSTIALIMRSTTPALADVLFGKGRGAILALLYGHPDQSFYYRQITRQLDGVSDGALHRELGTLYRLGLIDRTTVGKQVFYRVNRNHPVFPELRALVAKTVGANSGAPLSTRIAGEPHLSRLYLRINGAAGGKSGKRHRPVDRRQGDARRRDSASG